MGFNAPFSITKSLWAALSPAIFPNVHIAVSAHSSLVDEATSFISFGIAPALTTMLVCSDVPEVILDSVQVAWHFIMEFITETNLYFFYI